MKIRLLIIYILLFSQLMSCKVMFWKDTNSYLTVRWLDGTTAYEPVLHYESKLSWNPKHGNSLTRDYKTEILKHTVVGEKIKTESLITFEGWTLEGSLYQVANQIFLIRGVNDSLAKLENRQIFMFPNKKSSNPDAIILKEKRNILLAIPSPDGNTLGVFTTSATEENRDGVIYFKRYDLSAGLEPAIVSEQQIKWKGVPGVPLVAWSKDSKIMYLFRDKDVIGITTDKNEPVSKFPACFIATRFAGENSTSGKRLSRQRSQDSGEVSLVLGKSERAVAFDNIPQTGSVLQVQSYCSQK